jgi:chemotaxis protein MotB
MSRRENAPDPDTVTAVSEAFTISFTSFSMILLVFFIFLDAIAIPDSIRKSSVFESLDDHFIRGDRPAESVTDETPEAIIDIARRADFQVVRIHDKYKITIPGGELFESGEDEIRREKRSVLVDLADLVARQDLRVRIVGHTDNVPIYTPRFESNWELSAARAVSVLRLFLSRGISEEKLSAAGRGEYRPAESNETEAGRAANRRVVLLISSPKGELSE